MAVLAIAIAGCGSGADDGPTTTGPPAPAAPGATGSATDVHVSPRGDDGAAGTSVAPLKTLDAALAKAADGATVRLAPGSYPLARPTAVRRGTVRVVGRGASIAGLDAQGATGLSFEGVRFTGTVLLTNSPAALQQESARISFRGVRFSTRDAGTSCLVPRNGTHDLLVQGNDFEGCFDGIETPGAPSRSGRPVRRVRVLGNRIRDMRSDGINFAGWQDSLIRGNTITGLHDPAGKIHNDGIQIMGGARRVAIQDNVVTDSSTQLLFVEPTIGGPVDGLDVENNLFVGAGASAVQLIDVRGLRFVGNTVGTSKFAGLMVRHAGAPGTPLTPAARGAVIADNLLAAGYVRDDRAPIRVQSHNLVGREAPPQRGPGDVFRPSVAVEGTGASTRARDDAPAADPVFWRHRPRSGPAADRIGYVAPADWGTR